MHGGDIYRNDIKLDFSININPLGMPENVRRALENAVNDAGHYPENGAFNIRNAIGKHFGIDAANVVCGNGASEIIYGIARAISATWDADTVSNTVDASTANATSDINAVGKARIRVQKKALIAIPCFSEYRRALEAARMEILTYPTGKKNGFVLDRGFVEEIIRQKPDLVMVANPGNPAGTLSERQILKAAAEACVSYGGTFAVDECFMELTGRGGEFSLVPEILGCENLKGKKGQAAVIGAFTKTYAIPGVRAGYALCSHEKFAKEIIGQLPEWNLSVFAEKASLAALETGPDYIKDAVEVISKERKWLSEELQKLGFEVCPSEANYILFRRERTAETDIYRKMLKNKILIRDCSDYEGLGKGWFRIAVRRHEDNEKLINVLSVLTIKENL